MEDGFISLSFLGATTVSVSLNLSKDILSGFKRINAFLNSCHRCLLFEIDQETTLLLVAHMELRSLVLGRLSTTALLRVEVVLTTLSR